MRFTSRTTAYIHPMVKNYESTHNGATKADIKTRVLTKLCIIPPKFFGTYHIQENSPLYKQQAAKKLLDYLEKCNIVLNNKNNIGLMNLLKSEGIRTLKEIIPEMSDVEVNQLADDLLYLMSHRNETETEKSNYPRNARDLLTALRDNLPKSGDLSPKEKSIINEEVAEVFKAISTKTVKIQSQVRGFQSRLKNKPEDDYGMRKLTSKAGREYYFSKNNIAFLKPTTSLETSGPEGGYKKLVAQDDKSVLLETHSHNYTLDTPYTTHEIEQLLLELGVYRSFFVSHRIDQQIYIAHNAGNQQLKEFNPDNPLAPRDFADFLQDVKILHQNGYTHGDLNGGNIIVTKRPGRTTKIVAIDMESLTKTDIVGVRAEERYLIDRILSACGVTEIKEFVEFELNGEKIQFPKLKEFKMPDGSIKVCNNYDENSLRAFIESNVKDEFKDRFFNFVKNGGYFEDDGVFLADMLRQ